MNNLEQLNGRFKHMAEARLETAVAYEDKHEFRVANNLRGAAEAYERCAREVARVAAGEVPPVAGEEWPEVTYNA